MRRTVGPSLTGRAREAELEFWTGVARAFGGAVFFSIPLLMTMEMWWLGFYIHRGRLALFMLVMIPMLVGLSHFSGFKPTGGWPDDVVDAFVAYGVGFVASASTLLVMGIVDFSMTLSEIVGKISVEAVPASIGAVLARSQFREPGEVEEERKAETGYWGELFLMAAGAVFFAFNVAPTEEMIVIAYKMTRAHAILLAIGSLLMMHAFVYAVDFRGQHVIPEGTPWWSIFLRFTITGYAIALALSAYVLWTFGRFEISALSMIIEESIVLAFPASLGAAAARLIL